jgi:carbonic anhydrase
MGSRGAVFHHVLLVRVVAIACLLVGCKAPEATAPEHTAPEKTHDAMPAHETHATPDGGSAEHEGHAPHARKFAVPFAAEADREDPLAQTRGYFQGLMSDNGAYMRAHDTAFFKAFIGAQKPRATVVACSDSRVQSPAFDATPENDVFFVRNIGNQVHGAEGSVEYGVHHLKTPVLLVLGHTGCGAVKAAMGDYSKESEAIRHELDPIKVPKKTGDKDVEPAAWLDAVAINVHAQVARALEKFDEEVAAGSLTVVGAIYDFRNDLRLGFGKVVIVDVNGNSEAQKIQAFERGVLGLGPAPLKSAEKNDKDAGDAGHLPEKTEKHAKM